MRAYFAFTKKELTEYTRNFKLFLAITLFALFGIMNPLTAKFLPDLLANFMPKGITILIAEPTNLDSWMQFFKNGTQTGLFLIVILLSGMMAKEYEKGTLINMVTKGLPRRTILFAKFTGALLLWTVSYWLCFFITWGYTLYYFPDGTTENLALAVVSLYLFGILLIAVLLLGAVLFKNAYGPLLFTGAFLMVLFLWNLFPKASEWNPLVLASRNMDMLQRALLLADLQKALLTAALLTVSALLAAVKIFKKTGL
ncbi:ABC transporter permease [Trichococcus ilyis]|jgi:ABC-2 type transport system permease protein|uniref:ABC-2 type transport system permease protein n=1 Tax=Trichococcus ilyis TaxID=640938 RepID=A0A143Z4W7_9LACT|nr:ABC transporter permease subunit [Trichococcus ilyis]CZR07481.1 Hypothetical protein TR210_2445 [Trichococcus ilyis]SEJ74126.1 ABC-2 type transport system permease protein [Trichococcus ilyis]